MNNIDVYPDKQYPAAKLIFNDKEYRAVVGKAGVIEAKDKREGDHKTPLGTYRILRGLYRPDKLAKPKSDIQFNELWQNDVWIDDPSSKSYNTPTKQEYLEGAHHEKLWREDHLYNLILDLNYNRDHPIPGKGSGIFVHVARDQDDPSRTPTEGCVALSQKDLHEILVTLPRTQLLLLILKEKL